MSKGAWKPFVAWGVVLGGLAVLGVAIRNQLKSGKAPPAAEGSS